MKSSFSNQDVLDDDAIAEIIKTCNVLKNERCRRLSARSRDKHKIQKVDKSAELKLQESCRNFETTTFTMTTIRWGNDYEDSF
jgi:hypothetical protein